MWIGVAVALVIGALALWLTTDSRFYIYEAQIVGARRVSQEEIFEASGLRALHVLWARPRAIEARILETLPALEQVEATCRLPAACTISVVERRPMVLWDADGELWWVDEEGAVFLAQEGVPGSEITEDGRGQWQVRGSLPRDDEGNLDERVSVALAELWKSGRDLPGQFEYAPPEGLSFVDERGWQVIVGQGSGMAERLAVLERIAAQLESREQTPRFVDVRFPKAPYYAPQAD